MESLKGKRNEWERVVHMKISTININKNTRFQHSFQETIVKFQYSPVICSFFDRNYFRTPFKKCLARNLKFSPLFQNIDLNVTFAKPFLRFKNDFLKWWHTVRRFLARGYMYMFHIVRITNSSSDQRVANLEIISWLRSINRSRPYWS